MADLVTLLEDLVLELSAGDVPLSSVGRLCLVEVLQLVEELDQPVSVNRRGSARRHTDTTSTKTGGDVTVSNDVTDTQNEVTPSDEVTRLPDNVTFYQPLTSFQGHFVLLPKNNKTNHARRSTFSPEVSVSLGTALKQNKVAMETELQRLVSRSALLEVDHAGHVISDSGKEVYCLLADLLLLVFDSVAAEKPQKVIVMSGVEVRGFVYQREQNGGTTERSSGSRFEVVLENPVKNSKALFYCHSHHNLDEWVARLKVASNLDSAPFTDLLTVDTDDSPTDLVFPTGKVNRKRKPSRISTGSSVLSLKSFTRDVTEDVGLNRKWSMLDIPSVKVTKDEMKKKRRHTMVTHVFASPGPGVAPPALTPGTDARPPVPQSAVTRRRSTFKSRVLSFINLSRDLDHVTLTSLEHVTVSGYLLHRTLLRWVKVWCVISGHVLYGFKARQAEQVAHLCMDLVTCTLQIIDTGRRTGVFRLTDQEGRTLSLCAAERDEQERWRVTLESHTGGATSGFCPTPNLGHRHSVDTVLSHYSNGQASDARSVSRVSIAVSDCDDHKPAEGDHVDWRQTKKQTTSRPGSGFANHRPVSSVSSSNQSMSSKRTQSQSSVLSHDLDGNDERRSRDRMQGRNGGLTTISNKNLRVPEDVMVLNDAHARTTSIHSKRTGAKKKKLPMDKVGPGPAARRTRRRPCVVRLPAHAQRQADLQSALERWDRAQRTWVSYHALLHTTDLYLYAKMGDDVTTDYVDLSQWTVTKATARVKGRLNVLMLRHERYQTEYLTCSGIPEVLQWAHCLENLTSVSDIPPARSSTPEPEPARLSSQGDVTEDDVMTLKRQLLEEVLEQQAALEKNSADDVPDNDVITSKNMMEKITVRTKFTSQIDVSSSLTDEEKLIKEATKQKQRRISLELKDEERIKALSTNVNKSKPRFRLTISRPANHSKRQSRDSRSSEDDLLSDRLRDVKILSVNDQKRKLFTRRKSKGGLISEEMTSSGGSLSARESPKQTHLGRYVTSDSPYLHTRNHRLSVPNMEANLPLMKSASDVMGARHLHGLRPDGGGRVTRVQSSRELPSPRFTLGPDLNSSSSSDKEDVSKRALAQIAEFERAFNL